MHLSLLRPALMMFVLLRVGKEVMHKKHIAVIGAGIVGTCSALMLQEAGYQVSLIDRRLPGCETSYGNAGVLCDSAITVLNSPDLLKSLPSLLFQRGNDLHYAPKFIMRHLPMFMRFLFYCHPAHNKRCAPALRAMQLRSISQHKTWIKQAQVDALLQSSGWLKVFRQGQTLQSALEGYAFLRDFGCELEQFSAEALREYEPALSEIYVGGVLFKNTYRVNDPAALTQAYLRLFKEAGGRLLTHNVVDLRQEQGEWQVVDHLGVTEKADELVIAAGPWSPDLVQRLGYRIPMFWERGYHQHFAAVEDRIPRRSIHDVDAGFVLSPMAQGLRVLSSVELAHRDAPPNYRQLQACVHAAREAIPLGVALDEKPWLGARPTLVDSMPIVGRAPRHAGLWFNFGHQHLGLSMAPGSAVLLRDLMQGQRGDVPADPFRADRFRL